MFSEEISFFSHTHTHTHTHTHIHYRFILERDGERAPNLPLLVSSRPVVSDKH